MALIYFLALSSSRAIVDTKDFLTKNAVIHCTGMPASMALMQHFKDRFFSIMLENNRVLKECRVLLSSIK